MFKNYNNEAKRIKMNVLIILPGLIPSTIIGVLRPLTSLESSGEIKLRVRPSRISLYLHSDIDWCDVAVFCRNCETSDLLSLYELKRKGKRIVFEIDDNFQEISLNNDVGAYHRRFFRQHVLRRFYSLSDITRVYSDRILKNAVDHGARTQYIKGYFDKNLIKGLHRKPSVGVIKIAYPTGRIDNKELEIMIFSAMRSIMSKYSGQIQFHLWKKSIPRELIGIPGVILENASINYKNFIASFYISGFDIAIAPGVNTPFFHSKTNNKYREYGGCGVPGIYSNFEPYANSVVHESTGLLVGSTLSEWIAAIERLYLDSELRELIAKNAQKDVFTNYSFENSVNSWRNCFHQLSKENSVTPDWVVPRSKKGIIIYCYIYSSENNSEKYLRYKDQQMNHIRHALHHHNDDVDLLVTNELEFMNIPQKNQISACIIPIFYENDLQTFQELMPACTSIIFDLTNYKGDIDEAILQIKNFAPGSPQSFLVTFEQSYLSSFVSYHSEFVIVDCSNRSTIKHEFSLLGYPAAYLDILERHRHYGSEVVRRNIFVKRVRNRTLAIVSYISAAKNILMWVKLRLGFRLQ